MPETVQLIDPSGRAHDVPFGDAAGLLTEGWHQQTTADTSRLAGEAAREADYGGLAGGAKAVGYGLARGGTLGLSDIVARAAGVPKERLQGLKAQNEGLSIGSEIIGGLVPAFGAPGSLLAKTPAGVVSNIGKTIVEATEGASALSRAGTIAAGAAIEGGLYGGGQYLSQVAIEDKPLAAEGFLGAMGKGALWAAPVGGALSLGADVLTRAKSLFPKTEVTRQAARAVDQEATSALSTAVRDGDTMLELARQRIAQTEAQAGASQTAERASRAMFGAADPAAMQNQVAQSVDHAKLTEAADRYTQAKARLDDWVRAEADPDLERALLRIRQPELQVGAPRLRSPEFGEVVPAQSSLPDLGEFGLERTNVGKRSAIGTPGPHEPPRVPITTDLPPLPIADRTTAFDSRDLGLAFDPRTRTYHDPEAFARRSAAANEDLLAALGGTQRRLDAGEGMAAIARRDVLREQPSGLEGLLGAQRRSGIATRTDIEAPSVTEQSALRDWQNGQYIYINDYARSGKLDPGSHFADAAEAEATLRAMDSAIAQSTTDAPETLYRGIGSGSRQVERGIKGEIKVGSTIQDPGYESWSTSRTTGLDYTNKPGSTMLEVELPAGSIGRRIEDDGLGEAELLRPRNSKYEVVSIRTEPHQGRDVRIATVRPVGEPNAGVMPNGASAAETKPLRIVEVDLGDDIEEVLEGLPTADSRFSRIGIDEYSSMKKEFKPKLSVDEREAIREYGGNNAWGMNKRNRQGLVSESDRKTFLDIDSAIDKGRLSRSVQVYRGLEGEDAVKTWNSLKPGDRFIDRAWGSTSTDIGSARRGEITLAIDVPEGYPAAAIPPSMSFESEILLRRDTTYEVVSLNRLDDGHIIAHVRVVPTEAPRPLRFLSGEDLKTAKAFEEAIEILPRASAAVEDPLLSALRATGSQLDSGAQLGKLSRESPAATEYATKKLAKRADDAAYFRERNAKPSGLEGALDAQRIASTDVAADDFFSKLTAPRTRDAYVAQNIGRAMREEGSHAAGLARLEREWTEMSGTRAVAKEIVDRSVPIPPGLKVDDDAIQKALRKHNGKNVDVGADLGRAAKAIGDVEEALAGLVDVLGPDAPATAAAHAKAWKAATEAQVEAAGKSAAKSAVDMQTKIKPLLDADKTIVDSDVLKALRKAESADSAAANRAVEQLARKEGKARTAVAPASDPALAAPAAPAQRRGAFGLAADVGTALEVLNAMGVHVPDVSGIPVIGPVLSMYLKARAVLGILGRKGGSIGRSTESVVASKSAAVRDRVNAATAKLLDLGAAGAKKAGPIAGPAGALGYRLFPGDGETKSKDPRVLYDARMDEIGRALQPGAIENAVADRIRTADPDLQDAIAAQTRKGIEFLASKAPRESVLASMIPGDGKWHPSKASIEKFSRYVAAVHDPAGVLEDLAHGHVSIESAEALRTVYPKLYAEAQRILLEHAAAFRATLPYSRRVSISLMYQVPVDGTMSAQHMQYLATPAPGAQPAGPTTQAPQQPALAAPLELGQQTLTSLERRAGA